MSAFLSAFVGLALMALAMPQHRRQLRPGRPPWSPMTRGFCRLVAASALAISCALCVQALGVAHGLVYCLGQFTLAALLVAGLLSFRASWFPLVLGGLFALVLLGMASPASAQSVLPHELSPWGMFIAADKIVKAVMILLVLASLLTWTVLLAKTLECRAHRQGLQHSLACINRAHTLAEAASAEGIVAVSRALLDASEAELQLSSDLMAEGAHQEAINTGIKERILSRLSRIEIAFGRRLLRAVGVLASIAAVAPFVGLFGTVWGIMNSFIGISQANTTNLAVVAPGIAEALLATALGLVAAIPAVVIYNRFTHQLAGIKILLADYSAAILRLVSRDLDCATHGRLRPVAKTPGPQHLAHKPRSQ